MQKFVFVLLMFFLIFTAPLQARSLLVFAPHPDDEAISLGAFIADKIRAGYSATGVIITDGEAFAKAVRANRLSKKIVLAPIDFLKLGRIRRKEGAAALSHLGIKEKNQIFMGYPGNAVNRIYKSQKPDALIRSRATRQRFGLACWRGDKRQVAFTRKNLTADLDEILKATNPDIIIMPVHFDSNSDHSATNALLMERLQALGMTPTIKGYLVHQGSRRVYPKPFGYRPDKSINDPVGFPPPERYKPTPAGNTAKEKALRCHKTQLRLKDGFLLSFIRKEEIYWSIPPR